jgi:hypothetical protein
VRGAVALNTVGGLGSWLGGQQRTLIGLAVRSQTGAPACTSKLRTAYNPRNNSTFHSAARQKTPSNCNASSAHSKLQGICEQKNSSSEQLRTEYLNSILLLSYML